MSVSLGHCTVDLEASEVRWPDRVDPLTPIEAKLLGYLVEHAGAVVPRSDVLTEVWGYHPESNTHTVGVIVRRVRKKIEVSPGQPMVLRTVRGQGWSLVLPESAGGDAATNLTPTRQRFVGRRTELERLQDVRMVTVTGPPGVGKSRLAVEHGHRCVTSGRFSEVWLVELDGTTSRDQATARVADVIGVPLRREGGWVERVGRALAGRGRILLILDEAEAIAPDIAHLVDRWLDMAPHCSFLVTSRVRLKVVGERVLALKPLARDDGIELFVDRASARADISESPAEIASIVELLDGLPLAIELAAARIGLRSASTVLDELRAHSAEPLLAAVQWTCGLLAPWERRALAQTSVFRGGFTLDAARAVLAPGPDHSAEGAVASLVDWSLLVRRAPSTPRGSVRFGCLAFIAEFAASLLDADDPVPIRHAAHYAQLGSDETQRSLHREGGLERVRRMEPERANLARAARHGGPADAAACARALASLSALRGPVSQGVDALRAVLERPDLPDNHRYRSLMALARALIRMGDHTGAADALERAEATAHAEPSPYWRTQHAHVAFSLSRRHAHADPVALGESALEIARALGDVKEISVAEVNLANALMDRGETARARQLQQTALEHAIEAGDERGQVYVTALIATWALQNDAPGALDQVLQARQASEAIGDWHTAAWLSTSVISGLRWAGRYEEAIEAGEHGIQLAGSLGDASLVAICRGNLATALLDIGEVDDAIELLTRTIAELREVSWPAAEGAFLSNLAEARARRGEDAMPTALAAIDILEQHGTPTQVAMAWVQRGATALWLGNRADAETSLKRSAEVAGDRTSIGLERARQQLRERLADQGAT